MPNTLPDLVAALRVSLLDTTVPYLWTDDALNQCVSEAVTEHAYLYPRLVYTLYDVARTVALSSCGSGTSRSRSHKSTCTPI